MTNHRHFFKSEAQQLTIVKMSKFGGGIGAPSKEERLKEAADIHLRLGQIQRYCELMVELGQVRRQKRHDDHRVSKLQEKSPKAATTSLRIPS